MASYHKWDVKNDFAYVLQFFSLISDDLGGVTEYEFHIKNEFPYFDQQSEKKLIVNARPMV